MTAWAGFVFWSSLLGILYAYFGYPLLLFVCYGLSQMSRDLRYLMSRRDRRRGERPTKELPPLSMLIAAYNEEEHLEEKISNIAALDYPADKLQVVIVSDGSSDGTNAMLRQISDSRIEAVIQPERGGKAAALNVALEHARHDLFVFSDCSTMFSPDALRKLVRHFTDPSIGLVCGSLLFEAGAESRQTEGVYWKYETVLRLMEARLGATLTPSGAMYAVRRSAYAPPRQGVVVDDIVTSMNARRLGYKVHYDPEAKAVDYPASTVAGEFKRRVRIATGSFLALSSLLKVPLHGFTAFAFVSHKLLRWIVPLLLILVFASNLFLLGKPLYCVSLLLQVAIFAWAAVGFVFRRRLRQVRFALVGYFLVAMNLAFLVGLLQSLTGRKESAWQRVQ
jgi:cellulose synthase/poly-beta-1,6-N-acetylglucosamine synthase-like glycosyltransferase